MPYRDSLNVTILVHGNVFVKPKYRFNENEMISGHLIPKDFISDIATIPRLLWWLLPPVSVYAEAAAVHDWLLDNGVNRLIADRQFSATCDEYKVAKYVSIPMRCLMSIFGFIKKPKDYLINPSI